jgi:putative ubiquitin-RnfH superfamily antitoxin RatB of RatAB toxin-antitoxin module
MRPAQEGVEIDVELVYAEPGRAVVKAFRLLRGACIADLLGLAAAALEFSGIDMGRSAVGVFGRLAPPSQLLKDGDRVEIYRPLAVDPKNARRARVREDRRKQR